MQKKIFFFHNGKAGGTAVREAIKAQLGLASMSPVIENDIADHARLAGDYKAFRGFAFYSGHYGRDVFEAVRNGHVYFTNFRHPVTRLASLYNFYRFNIKMRARELAEDRFYPVLLAKSGGFEAFIRSDDPRVTVYTRNQHFRQLTASPWVLEGGADVASDAVAAACRFIDGMPCFYVCEYPEVSLLWMREVFGLRALRRVNSTGRESEAVQITDIGWDLYKFICERNDLDLAVYHYAVSQLLGRERLALPAAAQ